MMPPKHADIALRHTQTGCGLLGGGLHRWLQTLLFGLDEASATRTRIHPQAIALVPPHSCKGHTSNRTRSNRDAKDQPSASRGQSHQHAPQTPPPLRLSSPPSQPHELVRSASSRVPADSAPGLRSAGAPQLPHTPKVNGPTMSHTQRPADPCTYPHLGGSAGRAADRLVSGGRRTGSGAGSGWGPLQRPRRVGSVRLSVRGSHGTEAAAAGPPPPHMPAPAGGGGSGQSGAALSRRTARGPAPGTAAVLPLPPSPLQPCFCKVAAPPRS